MEIVNTSAEGASLGKITETTFFSAVSRLCTSKDKTAMCLTLEEKIDLTYHSLKVIECNPITLPK